MATHNVVAVWDRALGAYIRLFTAPSIAIAARSFIDDLWDPKGEMVKHPGDYELHHLASFEDITGRFEQVSEFTLIHRGGNNAS